MTTPVTNLASLDRNHYIFLCHPPIDNLDFDRGCSQTGETPLQRKSARNCWQPMRWLHIEGTITKISNLCIFRQEAV